MALIRGLTNLKRLASRADSPLADGCVMTVGNFDGVHRGHQTILGQVRSSARRLGVPSVVMVFEPQPREFFQGADAPSRLMGFRQKYEALIAEGVDYVLCIRFDERFRQYSAMGFIEDVLIDGLSVRHIVVGDDFRFGNDRSGDFKLLVKVGEERDFTVENTQTVTVEGERVSSTRIRNCLSQGLLGEAETLLGRPYAIAGRVVYGRQLGRQLDCPTANIRLTGVPPMRGVCVVTVDGESVEPEQPGVANIGYRPTVDGRMPALEVHLLDFSQSLYGERLTVTFRHYLRNETNFDSLEKLQKQIQVDIEQARDWFRHH